MQIPCSNQHVICKMCWDKLFEITIFENGRNISRCYCREEIIVSDCVPAKAITRIINNISIRCPNSQNGCQWNCDAALDSVVRQNHVTDCRWGFDTWKFAYSYKVVFRLLHKTLNSFRFSESSEMKKVKVERKLYLDRSRSLYLKNIKMRKQIEQIKKIISESEPV